MNAGRTPTWILHDHLEDKLTDLFADSPATAGSFSRFAQHRPIPSESSPVPAGDRFWQNEKECFFPPGPELECHNPKEFVERT